MDTRTTLVAQVEASKAMEPGERPFDHPAGPAESGPMRRPALGELRADAAVAQSVAMGL